jgi:hypothetical protein
VALAILREPDAGGVRIDVTFDDAEDAEWVWMNRVSERNVWRVETRFEGRYRPPDDMGLFMMEAAVLAAREYLKLDPLDQPPPICSAPARGRRGAGRRVASRGSRRGA